MSPRTRIRIPLTRPLFDAAEERAVREVIRSGWVTQGRRVAEFEERVAEYVGAADAVAVSSCTTALHLALVLAGVGNGDEVIVPSLSYIATANPVLHVGATPVFCDVDPATFNLDPVLAEERITRRTKAVVLVHQFGLPADLDAFLGMADRHGLFLIQDGACALGSAHRGSRIGGRGPITCFSFHPRKIITTGEGGMMVFADRSFSERARRLRSQGASVSDLGRHQASRVVIEAYPEAGYNYRMTDLQAAMGLAQMGKLDGIVRRRRALAERYARSLDALGSLRPPVEPEHAFHTYQSYCVRLRPGCPAARDETMEKLLACGIATRRGCMAIHEEACYERFRPEAGLPVTEACARDSILLPLYPSMTDEEQDEVVRHLRRLL